MLISMQDRQHSKFGKQQLECAIIQDSITKARQAVSFKEYLQKLDTRLEYWVGKKLV